MSGAEYALLGLCLTLLLAVIGIAAKAGALSNEVKNLMRRADILERERTEQMHSDHRALRDIIRRGDAE